ncbi:nicotinate phosphoribosyltransferase [Microaceticoccus formicicus]|uniref:nicotinate phosphoribosyltransferase n=1 Tax=Microaceticoccus formicicus TaxID=3118105 RepID=UPI003CD03178|nr:nicotinate phosphoribosyltransferase [Peptoniphilaceae bacterium AMB_02]
MNWKDQRNLTMLADFYEFTMANGYLENDMHDIVAYFELFFRNVPDNGGFAIAAGLEQVIEYIQNLEFTEEDIEYFKSKNIFSEKFLDYLRNFKFTCDIWAVPEGRVVFPREPLVIVRGPVIQAQMLETMLLLTINHQSLIATKANRIVRASQGRAVMEFGSRRAQGADAATYGARAAYIGGVVGTANTIADRDFNVPALGTMAHSWVQLFPTELDAFKAYARVFPTNCVLLVDTYNTLKSGVPNAIKTFDEVLKPLGIRPKGIRLDSGDIAYLSKNARIMLDEAGYEDCPIVASSSLDEYKIRDMLLQGSKLDSFGVGERLITSMTTPVFGGVYKIVAIEEEGKIIPKIKISENIEKITNPGFKNLYRLYDRSTNKAEADLLTLHDEVIDDTKPLEIFHPIHTWKRKTLTNFYSEKLLVKIFENGNLIYDMPSLDEIKEFCHKEVESLWDEVKRFEYPHTYITDLSLDLWTIRDTMLASNDKI